MPAGATDPFSVCSDPWRKGDIKEIPAYKVEFTPLWSLSETEQANVDAVKATTEQTKAATAQIYVDMQVLDPSEVFGSLSVLCHL